MLSYPNIYLFRYQFFLQLKHDLLYGKLDCPFETVVQLSAFALQCKYFILYLIFIEFILFKVKNSWLGHQLFSAVALREKKLMGCCAYVGVSLMIGKNIRAQLFKASLA